MTNREINLEMKKETSFERKTTIRILNLINLAEKQKTHLELGYGSLHAWLIQEHKYSERSANRRIQAARLLKAVPEAHSKLEDGRVNLSTMAKAQSMTEAASAEDEISAAVLDFKARALQHVPSKRAAHNQLKIPPSNLPPALAFD